MSQENAVFSFELNESLYFEPGQEVAEILGISLDPEISIQPFNDYISIRGVIELNGEYKRANESETREKGSFDLEDYSIRRFVEQVIDTERGEATFSHRFPVEISVPTYRVSDLNDVTVSVDYFDYEIPDENQIRLTSIIAIQGINDIVETPNEVKPEEIEVQEEVVSTEKSETFRFDIKQQGEDNDTEIEQAEHQDSQLREDNSEQDNLEQKELVEEELVPSPPLPTSSVELSEDKEIEQVETEQTQLREENSAQDDFKQREVAEEKPDTAPISSVNASENKVAEQTGEEKVDYLSNMFRQDEESYSKMKLCIVQDNDTIDTIAERYQVNPLNISRQNRLEDEALSEGQLLFIPKK